MTFDQLSPEAQATALLSHESRIVFKNRIINTEKFVIDYNSDGSIHALTWTNGDISVPAIIFKKEEI